MGKEFGGSKRRRGKDFDVQPGMSGIMVTCNRNQEARSSSEILQLLEQVYEDSSENVTTDLSDETPKGGSSFAEKLANEVSELRRTKTKPFQVIGTGELGCIVFVKVVPSAGDPVELIKRLFSKNPDTGRAMYSARFCQRIIPLSRICRANLEELKREATPLIRQVFDDSKITYAIQFESRMSHSLDRKITIDLIAEIVGPKYKVDLSNPEYSIMIQVFKNICGISILPNYNSLKKYNIQEFSKSCCQ